MLSGCDFLHSFTQRMKETASHMIWGGKEVEERGRETACLNHWGFLVYLPFSQTNVVIDGPSNETGSSMRSMSIYTIAVGFNQRHNCLGPWWRTIYGFKGWWGTKSNSKPFTSFFKIKEPRWGRENRLGECLGNEAMSLARSHVKDSRSKTRTQRQASAHNKGVDWRWFKVNAYHVIKKPLCLCETRSEASFLNLAPFFLFFFRVLILKPVSFNRKPGKRGTLEQHDRLINDRCPLFLESSILFLWIITLDQCCSIHYWPIQLKGYHLTWCCASFEQNWSEAIDIYVQCFRPRSWSLSLR